MQQNIYMQRCLALFFGVLLGCSTPAPPPAAPPAQHLEAGFPFQDYLNARAQGETVLRIAPEASLVTIIVRRSGPLARMGHDHLIAARQLEGYAMPAAGHGALRFRLDQLNVDDPALRSQAGLATQPSADAIAGTRRNMLKALEAERYPWLLLRARQVAGQAGVLHADITLHGVTRQYLVPAQWTQEDGRLHASGSFTVHQSDFGITPFAVFGGALAVADELELRFSISAQR